MKERSSYKQTFLDRHGPEGALRIRAFGYGTMCFGLVFGVAISRGASPLLAAGGGVALAVAAYLGSLRLGRAAGATMRYFTQGGSSTPYQEQYSQEQALVMQRNYAAALELFEERIAAGPGDARVRIAAGELYMTHGENPKRAGELFREVQRMPAVPVGQDVYVSNKLADLYLGPLQEPRRALVEFRRLVERYPGSPAATHARAAIANLKGDLLQDQRSS